MIYYVILIMNIIILLFYIVIQRKRNKKELNSILNILDNALNEVEQEEYYNESINSAIVDRLNKLIYINKKNREISIEEREYIKTLISDISHQVRTPLSNIILYSELLKEKKLSVDEDKMVSKIYNQSKKIEFFIKELTNISYMESSLIEVNPEYSSINELISISCQEIEVETFKKNIDIQYNKSEEIALFDLKWTKEALINIIYNGIKYSKNNSNIFIEVIPYEVFICIKIIDEGIGILKEEQGFVFQRFYRSPSVSQEEGLGIGLFLAREIIEKQNGYIKIDSEIDKGTIFSIYLLK